MKHLLLIDLQDVSSETSPAILAKVKIEGRHDIVCRLLSVAFIQRPELLLIVRDAIEKMDDIANVQEITYPDLQ